MKNLMQKDPVRQSADTSPRFSTALHIINRLAYGVLIAALLSHMDRTCHAAEPTTQVPALLAFRVEPPQFELKGHRARQQLIVSGTFPSGEAADFTPTARYECLTPGLADVTAAGVVLPRGHGTARIRVRVGQYEQIVTAEVTGIGQPDPVDFQTEVIAALSRAGCSQGACHGSPQGKNGFRLSLRGFDPAVDLVTLVREDFGRRTNPNHPDNSLILKKGLAQVPHQGGKRFAQEDPSYQVLRAWIQDGCQPSRQPNKMTRLEVLPSRRQLHQDHPRQQLVARAHFADGTIRDVTELAVFTVNREDAASVSAEGVVQFRQTGEASFLVRYLDFVAPARITYVRHDPDYKFSGPAEVNLVDTLTFARQRALQLNPAPLASDEVFLRRVYLDTIGTLPTADEARQFLASREPDKRARVIEALLDRDEFATFWALKWADVMRGSEVTISKRGVHSFHRYLVQHFREDRSFERLARETLTALGNTLHNPAANFQRIARTPDEAAEAMSQLFLGVRIGCAKCHNHPFEAITQDDYYGFAAYFTRVKFKGKQFMLDDEIVYLDRQGEMRHPTKNVIVPPAAFGTPAGLLGPDDDRREKLVEWLVQPDNRYFAPSLVNRVWFHLLGRGLVDPVDDFRDTNPPSNPELLDALSKDFANHGFRLKPLVRTILNSSTYQLSTAPGLKQSPHAAKPDPYFTQAVPRMLTAEQVLDAITSVTGLPENFPGYPPGTRAIELADGAVDHPFLKAFSKPVRDVNCECAREEDPSLSQVIHLLNNPQILSNLKSPRGRLQQWLKANKSDEEIIDLLYLTTLTRHPTQRELTLLKTHIHSHPNRPQSLYDIQHALLNTNEFLLRH